LRGLDPEPGCRAIVVRTEGKHFCAGRDFGTARSPQDTPANIYSTARGLLELQTPWVAELTGGSIGAGMGLALTADFRVAARTAYLSANFVTLGLHHGFGLSATLPRVVGAHRALELLATGRRVGAQEALELGLVDAVADDAEVAQAALALAKTLAGQSPLALAAIRATMRADLPDLFAMAVQRELAEQTVLTGTEDYREAAAAAMERRRGRFVGR
jgi:enoyl-CoA hydratase/carnithine racemase